MKFKVCNNKSLMSHRLDIKSHQINEVLMAIKMDASEMILYTTEDGTVKIDTVIRDETLWFT